MARSKETETSAEIPETTAEGSAMVKDPKADWVTIELFRDGDKYKDDVVVAVNGTMYQIQRGVPVKVPPAVYEILQNSKKQDAQANSFVEKLEADYANKAGMMR